MQFNTAIFYDLENLIGGYGLANIETLSNLSLKQITEQIKHSEIGKISIQRAYADWSVPRLSQLKSDMVELGITPIQMFGFGKGITRNTADIHLAIDAMEVALTKTDINVFVIVSGDGGFSSLASKLHEYGKTVIGVGYKRNTNKVLEALVDEYIWLNESKMLEEPLNIISDGNQNYLIAFAKKYKPTRDVTLNTAKSVSQEIIDFVMSDSDLYNKLNSVGINISVFLEMLKYRLVGFQTKDIGYGRSVDFIKAMVKQSELKIVLKGTSDYRLSMKNNTPIGYSNLIVEDEMPDEHTVENYRQILSNSAPLFRQFDKETIAIVCDYLCKHKSKFQNVIVDDITKKLDSKLDHDMLEIVKTITTLISGACFTFEENSLLIQQKLSYVPENTQHAFELLENAMQSKVYGKLKEVNVNIFKAILK